MTTTSRTFGIASQVARISCVAPHDQTIHERGTTSSLGLCSWHGKDANVPAKWDAWINWSQGGVWLYALCTDCLHELLDKVGK